MGAAETMAIIAIFATPILQITCDRLASCLRKRKRSEMDDNELDKLKVKLLKIRRTIQNANSEQLFDEVLQPWIRALNSAAYEAHDLLEDYESQRQILHYCVQGSPVHKAPTDAESGEGQMYAAFPLHIQRGCFQLHYCVQANKNSLEKF
uniref:Disease resistance N-terminal domain-containing protein n=1 Tax=Nelumbo nucifera TaxID=4432 RepID=A0A822YYZ4_NELNU|nr:TPA_asm: hypothetical protein HUJ06_013637 [Nelumbo nucifera]